jgi:hypothetical protein
MKVREKESFYMSRGSLEGRTKQLEIYGQAQLIHGKHEHLKALSPHRFGDRKMMM